jgi:hypothetical protein
MKKLLILPVIFLCLISCTNTGKQPSKSQDTTLINPVDTSDMTNNFYDNTETIGLPVGELTIEGEIANPGKVDFSVLKTHSVIVKETLLDSTGNDRFAGAYRYDGYSLFDILDKRILKKANSAEFNPIIDLYVEVENTKGEKVVFSWGEIYYPNNLHKILIASGVSRIVPSKTKELWPLPSASRIVAAADLITERNISMPVKITVKSYPVSFVVDRNLNPLYSPQMELYRNSISVGKIDKFPDGVNIATFNTIFYGRGKGIHSTTPFKGVMLKELIQKYYPLSKEELMTGILCIAGKDGYRCAVSYSELFNRNDQQEFLVVRMEKDENGGQFRIFSAADFFSDRAIKAVSEIHLLK